MFWNSVRFKKSLPIFIPIHITGLLVIKFEQTARFLLFNKIPDSLSGSHADAFSGTDGVRIFGFNEGICNQYALGNYSASSFWNISGFYFNKGISQKSCE